MENKVIGKTQSGKPVYRIYEAQHVKDYTIADAVEAGATFWNMHREHVQKAVAETALDKRKAHACLAAHYEIQANLYLQLIEHLETSNGKLSVVWN